MKRLVIMTVGKTHSGKTTFARKLEQELNNSLVIDQDNQARFINANYDKLQPKQGPNTFKYELSRLSLLEEPFNKKQFVRILVNFDISDEILKERVVLSTRSTTIFRNASSFEEVLLRQLAESKLEDVVDPKEGEADHLFAIKDNEEVDSVIKQIIHISKG